jgi:hypothetical protein
MVFLDIIDCDGDIPCHVNASCMDIPGSYECKCLEGFTGDGSSCDGMYFASSTVYGYLKMLARYVILFSLFNFSLFSSQCSHSMCKVLRIEIA